MPCRGYGGYPLHGAASTLWKLYCYLMEYIMKQFTDDWVKLILVSVLILSIPISITSLLFLKGHHSVFIV